MSIRTFAKASLFSLLLFLPFLLLAQQTRIYGEPGISYRLGLDLIEKKQYGAAQNVFDALQERLPADESVMRLDAQYYDALCDYKLDHPEAKQKFTDFIRFYPDHSKTNLARLYLGFIEYDSRRYRDALQNFTDVDPYLLAPKQMAEYLYKMGYSHIQQEDYAKAKEVLFPILNTESQYRDAANYYYAHIAYLEKDYTQALTYFNRLSPDSEFGEEVPFYILQINYVNNDFDAIATDGPDIVNLKIEDKKKKAEAARIVAEAFYTLGDYENTLKYLDIYQDNSRKSLSREENYQQAYALYQTGDYENAITAFQKITSTKDEMAQNAFYHLADCYLKTDEKKFAQNAFYSAYQIEGHDEIREDALFNYAKLTYEIAYDPFNSSIEALTTYITNYPGSERLDEAYLYLTHIFLSTRDYQTAIDAIENIRIKNQDLKAAYQQITYQRAIQLFNAVRYDEALVNFNKSLAYNFDKELSARARYWTGETHFRLGDYTKAIDYYDDFMVSPGAYPLDIYPLTQYNLGYAYFKLKYFENALNSFQQFVGRPSKNSGDFVTDALLRMGDCYFITQNYQQAISDYTRAINRNSTDSDYALFQMALSEGALGNYNQKITYLQKIANSYPGSSYVDDAYYEIAESYLLSNNNSQALQWYNRTISTYPNSSYVIKALQKSGMVHYNQNQYDDALSVLKKIVKDYPGTPESKEALATIRNIYIDKNAVNEYYAFAETVPFANVTMNEQDSVSYLAAENLYMNNNCAAAINTFADYMQRFPQGAFMLNAKYYKAECDYKLDNTDDALEGYNFVIGYANSRFTENALVKAGRINMANENHVDALSNYQKLEAAADYQNNISLAIHGQLICNYQLENYPEAISNAAALLQRDKLDNEQTLNAHYYKAKSAMAMDDLTLATAEFETTNSLSDGEKGAEAKYMLIMIDYQLKNYKKAESMVFELVNEYPAFEYWKAKAFVVLADIYAASDNLFQARQTLQSIIDNYPGEDVKTIAREKLEEYQETETDTGGTNQDSTESKNKR